jgi:terminal uridylyltransferase
MGELMKDFGKWCLLVNDTFVGFESLFTQLVLLVKYWSKRRDINEPFHGTGSYSIQVYEFNHNQGTLSSYAYVLMIIFYLQTLPSPVLPCLQRLPVVDDESDLPTIEVGEHNVYFYDDIDNLHNIWKSKNVASLGELLAGFFEFYANDFRYISGKSLLLSI